MNLLIFTLEKAYISTIVFLLALSHANAFEIDLSRRTKDFEKMDRGPASVESSTMQVDMSAPQNMKKMFPATAAHEVVILNTKEGFVPSKIQLKKGNRYTIHVVNVNDKEKNISFILDSFAQHFGTFFAKTKTFVIQPNKEGIYTYISPEVSAQGKIVVVGDTPEIRVPASTDD